MDPIDVLIIGAGPAGTAAAALLRKEGFSVLIVEKSLFPRFIIGESLLPHCMDLLDEANLLDAVQKGGYQKKNGAMFFRGESVETFEFSEQFTEGWSYTYQVPRADFDHLLANVVSEQEVAVWYEHEVTAVDFSEDNPRITVCGLDRVRKQLTPRFVLDASGYGRVLARFLELDAPSGLPPRKSLFGHVVEKENSVEIDKEKIWLCLHPNNEDVWYWVIPFSNDSTSLGVVAPPSFFEGFLGAPEEQLREMIEAEPNLARRFPSVDLMFSPRTIVGYSSAVRSLWGNGYALLGNAGGFLDPIFSSGITIALKSSSLAVKVLTKHLHGETVDWQRDYVEQLMPGVDVFRTYVDGWYSGILQKVFFYPRKSPEVKRMICSLLAGYAWDSENPFVCHPARGLNALAEACNQP